MADASGLPADLRAFLLSCIDSVEQADVLILMRRDVSARTTREVSAGIGLPEGATRHHLESLTARGLLSADIRAEVTYRYDPRTPDLRRYADLLAQYYASSRTEVVGFIATRSHRAMSTFARAFKLRSDE